MALVVGGKEKAFMKNPKRKKIQDPDMPIGKLTVVKNFLPPPNQLVFPDDNTKVTLTLSKRSINFFKLEAKKNNTKYQKMIRVLLDHYVTKHT